MTTAPGERAEHQDARTPGSTVLSVRADATLLVSPDFVVLDLRATVPPDDRSTVLAALREAQDRLVTSLRHLEGEAFSPDRARSALTWSLGSIGVHDEHDFDEDTKRHGPTGRVVGRASMRVVVRDFSRLTTVSATIAQIDHLSMDEVSWGVDADNDGWRTVRADAIRTALAKAADYADALGARVVAVDHVADAGLLAEDSSTHSQSRTFTAQLASAEVSGDGGGVPVLDPVPQEITAVIEARVTAHTYPSHDS